MKADACCPIGKKRSKGAMDIASKSEVPYICKTYATITSMLPSSNAKDALVTLPIQPSSLSFKAEIWGFVNTLGCTQDTYTNSPRC